VVVAPLVEAKPVVAGLVNELTDHDHHRRAERRLVACVGDAEDDVAWLAAGDRVADPVEFLVRGAKAVTRVMMVDRKKYPMQYTKGGGEPVKMNIVQFGHHVAFHTATDRIPCRVW